jgi:hypothetical protein
MVARAWRCESNGDLMPVGGDSWRNCREGTSPRWAILGLLGPKAKRARRVEVRVLVLAASGRRHLHCWDVGTQSGMGAQAFRQAGRQGRRPKRGVPAGVGRPRPRPCGRSRPARPVGERRQSGWAMVQRRKVG